MFQGHSAIFRQSTVQSFANTKTTLVCCWNLQNFVPWIPWRWHLGAETCRKFMLRMIFSCFIYSFFLPSRNSPQCVWASSITRFLEHTQRRTTVGRTPLDEWLARRRDLYLTTHNIHNRQTSMLPGGIRTHNFSRQAAVDLRLRPRGHWDRLCAAVGYCNY